MSALDTPETLLDAVRVPGQVVVDDQVGALQVDALACGVGGDELERGEVTVKDMTTGQQSTVARTALVQQLKAVDNAAHSAG